VKAIESNGGVVKYIEFAGEGHGWRQAKHIREGLEAELAWYRQVLNIK
jgi:dipeptidyl aminopeptidase/acylaminoacyl peptidase